MRMTIRTKEELISSKHAAASTVEVLHIGTLTVPTQLIPLLWMCSEVSPPSGTVLSLCHLHIAPCHLPSLMTHAIYLIGGTTGSASRQAYCTSVPSLIETAVPPDHLEAASTTSQILSSPPTWQVLPSPDCPFCSSTAAELGGCFWLLGGRMTVIPHLQQSMCIHPAPTHG